MTKDTLVNLKLSESEQVALEFLKFNNGITINHIPEKNERGIHGEIIPGLNVYRKLEKKGLVIITQEETLDGLSEDDPLFEFEFTPSIELNEEHPYNINH